MVVEASDEEENRYEEMKRFMQPRSSQNTIFEVVEQSLSPDLSIEEKEEYCSMIRRYPNLFITSY